MLSFLIAGCAVAPFVGLWLAVPWKGARRIELPAARHLTRAVCLVEAVVLWTVVSYFLALVVPFESGTWSCLVCGRNEDRQELAGWPLTRHAPTPRAGSYADWFRARVKLEHEHEWVPTGCHLGSDGSSSCYPGALGSFHSLLPRLPEEVYRELATRLADAPTGRRSAWLADFNGDADPSNPFPRVAAGEDVSVTELETGLATWLERHPRWR